MDHPSLTRADPCGRWERHLPNCCSEPASAARPEHRALLRSRLRLPVLLRGDPSTRVLVWVQHPGTGLGPASSWRSGASIQEMFGFSIQVVVGVRHPDAGSADPLPAGGMGCRGVTEPGWAPLGSPAQRLAVPICKMGSATPSRLCLVGGREGSAGRASPSAPQPPALPCLSFPPHPATPTHPQGIAAPWVARGTPTQQKNQLARPLMSKTPKGHIAQG